MFKLLRYQISNFCFNLLIDVFWKLVNKTLIITHEMKSQAKIFETVLGKNQTATIWTNKYWLLKMIWAI